MKAGTSWRITPSRELSLGLDSPPCAYCRLIHADMALAWQVHADCEPLAAIRSVSWFVLPPALETHFRRLHADGLRHRRG